MRNIVLSVLITSFFIVSCQGVGVRKQMNKDYKKTISFFDNKLIDHFPLELPDSSGYNATVPKRDTLKMLGFGVDEIKLWKNYTQPKYLELKNEFKSLSSAVYSANDTSLLLLFSFSDVVKIEGRVYKDQESPERQELARRNVTVANSLPVPLFELDGYKGNTISGLTDDFKLYVIDVKAGKYIDDKYLQECDCLPEKWKHGYSKGVALSDEQRVVIYWISVW